MAEIYSETLAVISTAHLTEEEWQVLDQLLKEPDPGINAMGREEGALVYTDQIVVEVPRLNFVLGFLLAKGFQWVLFDHDAEPTEGLETFDW